MSNNARAATNADLAAEQAAGRAEALSAEAQAIRRKLWMQDECARAAGRVPLPSALGELTAQTTRDADAIASALQKDWPEPNRVTASTYRFPKAEDWDTEAPVLLDHVRTYKNADFTDSTVRIVVTAHKTSVRDCSEFCIERRVTTQPDWCPSYDADYSKTSIHVHTPTGHGRVPDVETMLRVTDLLNRISSASRTPDQKKRDGPAE